MPVLQLIRKRFTKKQPLKGLRVAACLHVTTETANLCITLQRRRRRRACSAPPTRSPPRTTWPRRWCATTASRSSPSRARTTRPTTATSTPRSTTAPDHHGRRRRPGHARCTPSARTARRHHRRHRGDHHRRHPPAQHGQAKACCSIPIIAVNDADDQAHLRQPLRHRAVHPRRHHPRHQRAAGGHERSWSPATAGAGAAWPCAPSGMGANVIVTEVDPTRALEAVMDGFRVMPMAEAAPHRRHLRHRHRRQHVIAREHFELMKDGAIVANSGHFNVEIDIPGAGEHGHGPARRPASSSRSTRCRTAASIYLLGEGRLVNLAAAEGHPASVMDMSFANQALAAEYMVKNASQAGEEGLRRARGAGQAGGPAQAGVHGCQDRQPDAGAGGVPGQLVGRNVRLFRRGFAGSNAEKH